MNKKLSIKLFLSALFCLLFISCQENEERREPPVIHFDREDFTYQVKIGQELVITPEVENDDGAAYSWQTAAGQHLSSEKMLRYTWEESDEIYVNFRVVTDFGEAEEEILVIVAALAPPQISLAVPEEGFIVKQGEEISFEPQVKYSEGCRFEWKVDGKVAGTDQQFKFQAVEAGKHHLHFCASNEDGKAELEFGVEVKEKSDLPFKWHFKEEYHVAGGRELYLCPMDIENAFEAEYIWKVEGKVEQRGKKAGYVFQAEKEGEYHLSVTMDNRYHRVVQELEVTVCPEEGRYRRPVGSKSSPKFQKVYEYLPAPGQFINEVKIESMEEACRYAAENMDEERFISLGGFGGYVVVGFDHSIGNDGEYNIQIGGNSFDGSSEPGIVYVMQDENGDGLPNDNWYELKGSEEETDREYEITYYRPEQTGMDVAWTDNRGNEGVIGYNEFHPQPSYYPAWVKDASYKLRGTLLKPRSVQQDGIWYNAAYEWGYADNFSSIDRLSGQVKANANHFKISDAIGFDGKPVALQYIDFVKIQTAVNVQAGIIGEVSTEVMQVNDYNLMKTHTNN